MPRLHRQPVILPHNPRHSLVIHHHTSTSQFRRNTSITITPPMFQRDLLNRGSHFHLFLLWLRFLQPTVETCPAHRRELTHALDAQATLQRHHFPNLIVDAFSPAVLLAWRRASTFCKALLKKSTSSVFSARTRFK